MDRNTDSIWLEGIVERKDGFELDAVDRFSERLLLFAQKRLPEPLKRRVDAEDVVQSVFRSFFTRHQDGNFQFSEASDVWRLLAAMTWRKLMRTIRHHSQQQRDFHREFHDNSPPDSNQTQTPDPEPTPSSVAVMMELLAGIMKQLPGTHQKILELRLENYSIQEIADQLQVSMRTVNRTLKTVRKIACEMADREQHE
jgi:RNA polymerase sigma-70 factor (ECF subfamily)